MLKFATLSAAIAVALSSQLNSSLPISVQEINHQSVQANNLDLVVKEATINNATDTNQLIASFSTDASEALEKVSPIGMILGIAAVGGAIGIALSAKNPQQSSQSNSTRAYSSINLNFESKESNIRIEQASRKLRKQLLRLLHDDQGAANRLLSQVKMKNPNKSINWCVEKVIYDLERDRGSY